MENDSIWLGNYDFTLKVYEDQDTCELKNVFYSQQYGKNSIYEFQIEILHMKACMSSRMPLKR